MEHTIPLAANTELSHVGGKARNLGIMRSNNVPVPKGFVITCSALNAFLEANKLNLETCTADDIIAAPFPSTLEQEISMQCDSIFGPDVLLAVRSSGVSEDSAEHSFSGMYSSFLNTTREQLFPKIKECWASSRSERVIQYAHAAKSTTNAPMGVVVQEMVQSKVAGVVFTMHPVTMDKSYFVINAALGLGESLVSGHITPDTYICNKDTGEVTSQHLASTSPCLPPEALSQLLELSKQVQQVFSTQEGQDIEFAWDGSAMWAVQARPITTATSATHISRRPPAERKNDICCNHETVDVFPEVLTPLTWSTFDYIVHHSILERYKQKNIKFSQDCSMYELHWGRVYQNLTVADMMVQAEFGFNPDQSTQALKGDLWKSGTSAKSNVPLIDRVKGLARLLTSLWDSTNTATKMQQVIQDCSAWCLEKEKELKSMPANEISDGDLDSLRKTSTAKFCEFGCDYIEINVRLQIFYHATEVFLESAAATLGEKVDYFIAALLTDLGGVITFDMNKHLLHLSSLASQSENVLAFLSGGKYENFATTLAGTEFLREFGYFLQKYGYRAINELEAASPRWDEDPSFILGQIYAMAKSSKEGAKRKQGESGEAKRKKTEDLLIAQVPFLQRYMTRWAIGKLQDFTRLRENAKCVLVQFISLSRHYLILAASRFAQRGLLTARDDVFHLTLDDVEELCVTKSGKEGEIVNRVRESIALMERQKKLAYPEIFVGEVPQFASRTTTEEDEENVLKGIGASCGVVKGTARILHSPNDREKLISSKDILVCASTDPAWTPLFACCAGLVSVYGGMLSHGAIVAREYGIPSVLGVPNALSVIHDGMSIIVDGNVGSVRILSSDYKL